MSWHDRKLRLLEGQMMAAVDRKKRRDRDVRSYTRKPEDEIVIAKPRKPRAKKKEEK